MKAERRHQLQNNALAQHLETFPEMLKRQASKIMLAITAVLLVVFIIRYRTNASQNRQAALADALFTLRQGPRALRSFDSQAAPPQLIAQYRAQAVNDVSAAIETVLREADGTDGAPYRAEALVARGNLNWTLANLIKLPGAATQPTLNLPRASDDYLKASEDAFRDVISAYSDQIISWTTAELGLAAIAENRHDWDAAKQAYMAVIDNPRVAKVFKENAQQHLAILPQLKDPLLLGTYPASAPSTAPTGNPTTSPSGLEAWRSMGTSPNANPTTQPSNPPTTEPSVPSPAEPSTQPAPQSAR